MDAVNAVEVSFLDLGFGQVGAVAHRDDACWVDLFAMKLDEVKWLVFVSHFSSSSLYSH